MTKNAYHYGTICRTKIVFRYSANEVECKSVLKTTKIIIIIVTPVRQLISTLDGGSALRQSAIGDAKVRARGALDSRLR